MAERRRAGGGKARKRGAESTVAALIAAAGEGTRLGAGPKAFVELGGRTLLEHAVDAFRAPASPAAPSDGPEITEIAEITEMVVAVPARLLANARRRLPEGVVVIPGGGSRQETVRRMLERTEAELVLVHDAARPFLPAAVIGRVVRAAYEYGAATAALPVPDTLVEAATFRPVDREQLRAVQTPQGFRREVLLEAHRAAMTSGLQGTDDAGLVRALGERVALVTGSSWLFKITAPEDLEIARALEPAWRSRRQAHPPAGAAGAAGVA